MIKSYALESKKYFKNAEDFSAWVEEKENLKLTAEETKMILGYVEGHGYQVGLDEQGTLICVDVEEPENALAAISFEELIEQMDHWNYEFLLDNTVTGEWRERINQDSTVISKIYDRMGTRKATASELLS